MQGFKSVGRIGGPTQMYVCPNCDSYGCADYLFDKKCPLCNYPLFSNDYIYMPDFRDAYELAKARSLQNQRKKMGFGDEE